MTSCKLSPEYKKLYVKNVGEILVKNNGNQKFYSPTQVKKASSQNKYNVDWHC